MMECVSQKIKVGWLIGTNSQYSMRTLGSDKITSLLVLKCVEMLTLSSWVCQYILEFKSTTERMDWKGV